jgi:hypothetical protein
MRALAACILGLVPLCAVAACGEDQPFCFAGDYRACSCSADTRGYQRCMPSQDGYDVCVCDGKTPGLDAGRADADAQTPNLDAGDEDGDAENPDVDAGDAEAG